MTNKDDQHVLVIPAADAADICGDRYGVISAGDIATNMGTWLLHATPMRRGDAETDEQWLQIIPYTVIRCAYDKRLILCYRRSAECGEGRLSGKYSIGIGGHVDIDPSDTGLDSTMGMVQRVYDAAFREINEEVLTMLRPPRDISFRSVLRFNATPVDRVHLGLVFHTYTNVPVASTEDPAIDSMFFAPFEDLYAMSRAFNQANGLYGEFEGWSRALLKDMVERI